MSGKLNTSYALGAMIGATKILVEPGISKIMEDWQRERLRNLIEEIDRRGTSQFADGDDAIKFETE